MNAADLKKTLAAGMPVFGIMLHAAESMRWERALVSSGLDYVLIDAEHGSRDRRELMSLSLLAKFCGLTAIVRVPSPDSVSVAMALDAGADGVLVPYCETVEEVVECAWKTRLHPLKGRAFQQAMKGKFPSEEARDYITSKHQNNLFIMGVESIAAVENLDALLDCAPLDGVFVGPNDLTTSLGKPDAVSDAAYLDTLRQIVRKSEAKGLAVMIHHQVLSTSMDSSLAVGSRFVLHGSDVGMLRQKIVNDFAALRKAAAARWEVGDDHAGESVLTDI